MMYKRAFIIFTLLVFVGLLPAFAQLDDVVDLTAQIEADPDNAELYVDRGVLYEELGNTDAALEDYTQAIRLNDAYDLAYYLRGALHIDLGNYETGIVDLNTSVVGCESDCEYDYEYRGYAHYQLGNLDEAIADFDKALSLDPEYSIAYYRRGLAYFDLENYDRAIADFTASINSCEDDCHYDYYYRGLSYERNDEYASALADLNETLRLNPDFELAFFDRGVVYFILGEFEAARDNLQMAVETCSRDCDISHNYLALAQYRLNDLDNALENINEAIRLFPDVEAYLKNRGQIYHALQRYEDALSEYDAAIEIDAEFPYTYFEQGITYMAQDNTVRALAAFNTARKLGLIYDTLWEYERVLATYETLHSRAGEDALPVWIDEHRSEIEKLLETMHDSDNYDLPLPE